MGSRFTRRLREPRLIEPCRTLPEPRPGEARIMTWNVWGIPFAAPRMLSRPISCGSEIGNKLHHAKFDLEIVFIQEAWAWRAGIFWPLFKVAQFIERLKSPVWLLSYIIYAVASLCVLLPFIPPLWDPKPAIARQIARSSGHVLGTNLFPIGTGGASWQSWQACLDSGLMLLVNRKPSTTGFEHFKRKSHEDQFANKGLLWAHFDELNLLLVNTHLQAAGPKSLKFDQLRQIAAFLRKCRTTFGRNSVVVAGDFNLRPGDIDDVESILGLPCQSDPSGPERLDHVFGNLFSVTSVTTHTNEVADLDGLSDHPVVQVRGKPEVNLFGPPRVQ